jgi:hypothetical protein
MNDNFEKDIRVETEEKVEDTMLFSFNGSYLADSMELFKSAQREDLIRITNILKTPLKDIEEIKFEVFDTREGKQEGDPHHSISRASARFAERTIYRFWDSNDDPDPHYPHEITHLVAHTWSEPYIFTTTLDTAQGEEIVREVEMLSTSFFQEGLAIAVDEIEFKRKLFEEGERKYPDEWCKENIDKIPTLRECINFEGFGSFENKIVVPFAASLAKFLLTRYGINKFKKMYVGIKETNSPQINVRAIEKIYALSENELLKAWRNSLTPK